MDEFATEEQRVEAMRDWWQRNATGIVTGLVLAIVALLGWQYWQQRQITASQTASVQYDTVLDALTTGDVAQARERGQLLINGQPDSAYAVLAALAMARAAAEAGDATAALGHLDWVATHAGEPGLREIAHLRAARLLLGGKRLDEAAAQLAQSTGTGFTAEREELRGDIALARGDLAATRTAYTAAVAAAEPGSSLVQLKLDNLPAQEKK